VALLSELRRHDTPISTGATAVYHYKPALEKKYRFFSRFGDEVELHRVDATKGLIHLPRALCPVSANDNRRTGEKVDFPKRPTPRDNQVELFRAATKMVEEDTSGVLVAYTGWGKTVLGYHAAAEAGVKTLVITTKDDIYKQWLEGAEQFLGLDKSEIGEIRGDKCEVIGTKFVVAMIQSLSKEEKYPDWVFEDFGLVIFDECHRVPADQFSNVIWMLPAMLRIGLSATPERSDGKEAVVFAHIGPIIAQTEAELMVPKVLLFKSKWECPRVMRTDKETGEKKVIRLPHQAGKTTHIEKMIAADHDRNLLIAELVATALEKDRKIVVFSTLTEHLKAIHRLCRSEFNVSGRKMGFYQGASTKAEREHREREKVKPILFTTYVMMGEGTSLDWLDTAIIGMPRKSVTQPVGRIRREYDGKGFPTVMDVQDHDSPVFSAYAAARVDWYRKIGCEIKEMN
jgi:superfamily II DNA or RNA helicase